VVGKPFIGPGGRFNEMYGWDSYFAALGLLADPSANAVHIAKSMVDNFVYQINHYGKILNANRSYYLLRSQPPFLTDMGLRVHQKLKSAENEDSPISADEWLKGVMMAAIKEYEQVWMDTPRLVEEIGLSRYYSQGQGIPPETEASHFDSHLRPFAEKHGCDIPTFIKMYNDQTIDEPELDEYFCHDRSVRESGHDTTYRLDNCAANLLTVDLCSLLYKYESDISNYIEQSCGGSLRIADKEHLSCDWTAKAERRRELANKYLWNEEKGMYFDYDIIQNNQTTYESATTFWALWSRMASPHQANLLVTKALCRFEVSGGIVSGTKESLGAVSLDRPNRQWDYPTGWAPHQMLAWEGLINYGYSDDARRLVYRWLYMITCAFVDFNGVVPEKFNVVQMSHKVDAEYGNVGTEFKKVPREGFGWMNASYLVGQQYLTKLERRALGALVPLDSLLKNKDS
jgi:alpha,alpha-trehalase